MAGGTKVAAFTRKRQQVLVAAAVTPDPGKSEVEIAAVQVVVDDIHHKGAPEAVTPHVPIFPGAFQLFDQAISKIGFINISP